MSRPGRSQPGFARHPWGTAAQSGFVRGFSRPPASGENIQLAAPPSAGFGTLLALVHRRSTETHAALSFTVAGPSASTEFYIAAAASNNLRLWDGSTDSQSSITLTESEGWAVIAVTKAAGSATPRFHKCVLSSGAWTHSDATTGAIGNWSTSPTAAWFGTSGDGFDGFQGQIAVGAYWSGNALADVTLESLTSVAQISRANPTALWVLNQPNVGVALQDLIGTADQTAISGTTVQSAQIPNFDTGTVLGTQAPMVGIRPPMVVGPGPTQEQTTIRTELVAVQSRRARDRRGDARHPWATVCEGTVAGVADNFNRGNATPPSANWSTFSAFGAADLPLVGQQITVTSADGYCGDYWNTTQFGPDCEASITVTSGLPDANDFFELYVRLTDPTSFLTGGYFLVANGGAPGALELRRFSGGDGSGGFPLLASASQTFAAGDRLTLRAVGTTISVLLNGVTVLSVTDASWADAGYVVLDAGSSTTVTLDNFAAGDVQALTWNAGTPFVGLRPPAVVSCPVAPTRDQTTLGKQLVQTRPRPTVFSLKRVPEIAEDTTVIQLTTRVQEVRGQRSPTTHRLFPPAVVTVAAAQVYGGPRAVLTRIRPRRTRWVLEPPTTLQVFYGPRSVLTRIRPPRTRAALEPPTVLQTFAYGRVVLVRTRPRPTVDRLRPPTVVRVPSVEQEQQTIRVALVQTRPRPTEKTLRPPVVVRVPSVEQEQQTIRSWLVRARPRPTTKKLQPPAVVAVVVAPPVVTDLTAVLTRIRPRPTSTLLQPPIFYKATSEIRSALVRTRPQPTTTNLEPPTQLRVFTTGKPSLTRTRPRRTIWKLRPPTVVRVPSVEQQQRTIRTALTRIRPRPTTTELRPPRVLAAFRDNKLRVVLAPARRPKTRNVRPAVVYKPPVVTTLRSWLTETRPRPTVKRLYPPTVLFEFVFVNYPLRVWTIAVAARQRFVDRTKSLLRPPGPVRVPGNACLDDFPAAIACLDDFKANVACLEDTPGTVACLDDAAASVACLDDQSAAVATLEEEN